MGNVNMEATQIHDRTEAGKHQSVADHLAALDEIAKQIEDMPTFTSDDRAWLDQWENKLPELPADPETDGVKVLTATTELGETAKSWEELESGVVDYSTTEQKTGQKWIDGKDIYFITAQNVAYGSTLATNVDKIVDARIARHGKPENEAYKVFGDGFVQNDGGTITLIDGVATYSPWSSSGDLLVTTADHVTLYYTKTV